jgi:hypothetical protein
MKVVWFLITTTLVCIFFYSCEYNDLVKDNSRTVRFRYIKNFEGETIEDVTTGIVWNLSFLGATWPKGSVSKAIVWESDASLLLHLNEAGFNAKALQAFDQLLNGIKESSEYKNTGGIDIGRFFALTLTSSNHYYAITGAQTSLEAFRSTHLFDSKKAGIVTSTVSLGERVIEISSASAPSGLAFIAQEGEGSIKDNSFHATSFEVLDIMPNGQLRFAIYDSKGLLKTAADPLSTLAGKPSKCLWCHEISLLPLFSITEDIEGYYSSQEFESLIEARMSALKRYRSNLSSDLDFTKTQDHTLGELLYVSFMEPGIKRLSSEWRLPEQEVTIRLASLPNHENHEFPFLGNNLYDRHLVDQLAPYDVIKVPEDARELSLYEPDFIHF